MGHAALAASTALRLRDGILDSHEALASASLASHTLRARKYAATLGLAALLPLGIGGAERLVVDAAVALQNRGHSVVLHTAHHDTSRCFVETRDGTLAVRVAGDWLPRTLCGRLHIVCATLRALWLGSGLGC